MRLPLALASALLVAAAAFSEEAPLPSPRLILSAGVDPLSNGVTGVQSSLDLVFSDAPGRTWLAGAEWRSIDDLQWTVPRLGVVQRLGEWWHVEAKASVGPGSQNGGDFVYQRFQAGLGRRLGSRAGVDLSYEYLDIDTTQGHLMKASLWVAVATNWILRADQWSTLAGNVDTRSIGLHSNLYLGSLRLLAGGTYGKTRAELLGLPVDLRPEATRHGDVYLGAMHPFGRFTLGLVVAQQLSSSVNGTSVKLVFETPLGRAAGDAR